jgi:hypothetical protein
MQYNEPQLCIVQLFHKRAPVHLITPVGCRRWYIVAYLLAAQHEYACQCNVPILVHDIYDCLLYSLLGREYMMCE